MSTPQRVMRSYTRGLKIPRLIGRLTEDFTLPGGPYTLTQFMVGVATLITGYLTVGLWSTWLPSFSVISSQWVATAALLPLALGTAKVAGLLPEDTSPVRAVRDLTSGTRPAQFGTSAGKALEKPPRPVRLRARVLTQGLHAQAVQPEHADVRAQGVRPVAAATAQVPATTHAHPGHREPQTRPGDQALMGALKAAIKEKR